MPQYAITRIRNFVAAAAVLLMVPSLAWAVPNYAIQTGQPCTTCHIGAYGPQLTAFGRAFKIGGYTQTGGDAGNSVPISVMLQASYSGTTKGQGSPAANNYGANGNFAMDQISIFTGGRITDYLGAFVQGTFDGIGSTFALDNTDIRLTTPLSVGDTELRIGLDINNNPTVQDPFNSTYAWGYPYVSSALVPTPTAQPILAGGLAGNSLGATVYAWYDRSLYLEAGLYNTFGPSLLSYTGNGYGPGATAAPAPYARAAYEWNWNGQSAHIGGIFFHSNINPAVSTFASNGSNGRDSYTDFAADGGYQWIGDGTNIFSVLGIINHEDQKLSSSFATGAAGQPDHTLNQLNVSATYYYKQTYGATVGWQKSWGSADTALYAPAPLTGSANGKPNSNAFIFEADYVPFGKSDSRFGPWVNLKLGVQYTLYTQFNGGTSNYDGSGRAASDNNSLYVFAWMIF
jgi:hypothetical protein